MLLPTCFDLCGSGLMNIGLVFITASATQMLRQSLLLFVTLFAVIMYHKPVNRLHLAGLLGCTVSKYCCSTVAMFAMHIGRLMCELLVGVWPICSHIGVVWYTQQK